MKILLAVDGSKFSLDAVTANMLLGSTATKVLHQSEVPMLLVR